MDKSLIVVDPAVMMGKPVIRGTRITVELILEKMGAGETEDQLLVAHPHLTRTSIHAALAFAAEVLQADWINKSPKNIKHLLLRDPIPE